MTKPGIRSLLVMVNLDAAVTNGCTRFDRTSLTESTHGTTSDAQSPQDIKQIYDDPDKTLANLEVTLTESESWSLDPP